MQYPTRFSGLPEYAFPRLRALLDQHAPGNQPIPMSIGDPQHPFPAFVTEAIARNAAGFRNYPPNEGLPGLRAAISDWLGQRYGLPEDRCDPDRHIFPLNGTREGLFAACLALSPETKNGQRPAVLLPNPFYQCYAAAALAAGAEPVFLPCTAATGHLPDFDAVPAEMLARTTVAYLCSPANPQGAVAGADYWAKLLRLAETHDFRIFADECYSEIYRDTPPPGALQVAHLTGADPERVVAFHSLSKRSNLAGLRSGFAASGAGNIRAMLQLRSYGGAPLPVPLQHAAEACWRDEAHVAENRALYRAKFDAADEILGNMPGYAAPEAGFFLWLHVGQTGTGDGEGSALKLWREAGVRTLPGAYLARDTAPEFGGGNPGTEYIRAALVAPLEDVKRGLAAIRDVLGGQRDGGTGTRETA